MLGSGLLIQSPACTLLLSSSGFQGILAVIMARLSLFAGWWLIDKSLRFFHSLLLFFRRSLTWEWPEWANALPSLSPLIPSGEPLALSIEGLPNKGCLSISALFVGSVLMRPGLTFSQAPSMLFHIEPWVFLSFFATKIQLISAVLGPLLCTWSLVCSALCLISSFQGSSSGARPLVRSLTRSASDWALGLIIPSPPLEVGITIVSHFTLARAGASRPPQMKFLTIPLIWEHILGLGFQDAAKYHVEASRTWFATSILPARESRLLL